MLRLTEELKRVLKKPLGELHLDYSRIIGLSRTYKIISVGDICTINLLKLGIKPFLAVFDYRYMRKELDREYVKIINTAFKDIKTFRNEPGTISQELADNAQNLAKSGGAVRIIGEEDLTALLFIKYADDNMIVIYGQPNEGVVLIYGNDLKLKKKVDGFLSQIS